MDALGRASFSCVSGLYANNVNQYNSLLSVIVVQLFGIVVNFICFTNSVLLCDV